MKKVIIGLIMVMFLSTSIQAKNLWEIIDCSYCGIIPPAMKGTGSIEFYVITVRHKIIKGRKIIFLYDANKDVIVSVNWTVQ